MAINIQLYQNVKDTTGAITNVADMIEVIAGRTGASGNIEKRLHNLRKIKEKIEVLDTQDDAVVSSERLKLRVEYDQLKSGLPAVTWSGTFKKRNARLLIDYSGLICLDIDKIPTTEELAAMWLKIIADQYTHICFISPSGNGLKVIVKVEGTADDHKETFIALENYYQQTFNIEIDPSGKDVSRLCFLSYHKKIFVNESAQPFLPTPAPVPLPEQKELQQKKPVAKKTNPVPVPKSTGEQCNEVWESTGLVLNYSSGRNNFIHKFACNCNRVGISENDCLQFTLSAAADYPANEAKTTIASAYKANTNEHATFKKKEKIPAAAKSNNLVQSNNKQQQAAALSADNVPDFIFWKEHETVKGKGAKQYIQVRLELSRVDFCDFLYAKGFHLLPTGDEEGFQIVHSAEGIIKPIAPQQIKHFSIDWCKKFYLKEVEEMLRKGQTKYFAKNELDSLPFKEVQLKRDTEKETYFYFQNCYLVVDANGDIEKQPYSKVDGYIWESNKIKFDYQHTELKTVDSKGELLPYDQINCEFARFIAYASYNPNADEEKTFSRAQITQRFHSFCTAIGWLLDGYKHPANRVAMFAIDHQIGERNEANGRTGKSMIPQACEKLKRVANISGKNYDPKYQFCDEAITVDTQIINFNDMQRNFDVENIFEKIADPYSVNRRNQGFLHFKYINSPKVYYSTNFIPKGEGQSYKARMNVIEFSDYFNAGHTPYDEFGHGFFDDSWDAEEWQRFYNFMVNCVALYKSGGLIAYPLPNIEARKLVNDVVPEFIDYMDQVAKNTRKVKIELMEDYNIQHMRFYNKKITPHSFTSWIKKYCTTNNLKLNPKQNGKFDKSNSVEYITIADEHFQEQQMKLL